MKIVIIGSGNIAHYYCSKLSSASNIELVQLCARNEAEGLSLSQQFNIPFVNNLEALIAEADAYIFAVNDGAMAELTKSINLPNALLIHCAGSQSLDLLKASSNRNGIIWPIYSITKNTKNFSSDIPLIIDANSVEDLELTQQIALSISENVSKANTEQRKYLHLNAVLVNNFSNHLMSIAEKICEAQQLDFQTLQPIILQTAQRALHTSPVQSQTGPAIRNDDNTMLQQLQLLASHPEWQNVYKSLSESIIKMYE